MSAARWGELNSKTNEIFSGRTPDSGSSRSGSDLTNLDQSCSSLPSQAGGGCQDPPDLSDSQIPVWRRNGKFVNFFRSFIGQKPKERAVKTPAVFGAELTKLLADTGDEGETPPVSLSTVGNNQDLS